MDREESVRLHKDWWKQCRTCRHYTGDRLARGLAPARCANEVSPLGGKEVTHCGYCPEWDSFDVDAAIETLEEDERRLG